MWVIFALLAGIMFGIRGSLYHWASKLTINRNLMLSGVFSCGAFIYGALTVMTQTPITVTALVGLQMGLFSSIANGAMYKGFAEGKASIIAILTALPPIVVVILAFFMWEESLSVIQLIAIFSILLGLIILKYTSDISLKNLQGAHWGVIALFFFAFNDLSGKWSTILDAPRYPTLMFMFIIGGVFFYAAYLIEQKTNSKPVLVNDVQAIKQARVQAFKSYRTGLYIGLSLVLGMLFVLEAFAGGKAGLVSAIISINAVIVLLYTRFVAKEKLSKSELLGVVIIILAVVVIQLFNTD